MSTTAEALEALEQLPALRADLATAAGVVTALEAERDALRATVAAGDAQIAALQQSVADTARAGKREADALRAELDAKHAKLVEVSDRLRARNAELVAALIEVSHDGHSVADPCWCPHWFYERPGHTASCSIGRAALSKARGGQ